MIENSSVRTVVEDDLPMILAWRNHHSIREFMLSRHEITPTEHRKWYGCASKDRSRRLIIVEDKAEPIGFVQFANVIAGGISDWGFYARPEAPKGTGQKLGEVALKYAFNVLDMHKVCGQALASNQASIALHKRLGFTREGDLRDQHLIAGVYHSIVCFGLLSCEWSGRTESIGEAM